MKLSINEQSVSALRDYAEKIPRICYNLEEDIQRLLNIYNNVSEDVGPHNDLFEEMLLNIKRAEEISNESINELAYMLKCTADKMESYINHGASYGTVTLGNTDIKQRYHSEVNKRLNSAGTNPVVKEIYNEYANSIRLVDYDYQGTPFYNSVSNGIKLNAMVDLHNSTGNMSTYFHEVGHMMDDYAGNGHAWLSSDPEFAKALRNDVEAYVNRTMTNKHCDLDEAYDIISEEISGDWNAGVSDIFGSLTGCRCQGDWGHHITYWQSDPTKIEKEAFANMFEASVGDEKKLNEMKRFFPRAYSMFEYIIRSR